MHMGGFQVLNFILKSVVLEGLVFKSTYCVSNSVLCTSMKCLCIAPFLERQKTEVGSVGSEARLPGFKSQFCHSVARDPGQVT